MKLRNRVIGADAKSSAIGEEEGESLTSRLSLALPPLSTAIAVDLPSTSRKFPLLDRRIRHRQPRLTPTIPIRSHKCNFKSLMINPRCIHDLPDHFFVAMFGHLAVVDRIKVERVCRRWRFLSRGFSWSGTANFSYSSLLQQTACTEYRCIEDRPRIGNTQVRSVLQRCGRFVRNVDLSAFRDSLTYAVCNSISTCLQLHTLTLTGIQLTNSSLTLLGRHCSSLRTANLQRCFQESVVERGLSAFLSKCNLLRVLDVSENERLSGIPSFSHLPQGLDTLSISGCFRLGGQAIEHIRSRVANLSTLVMDGVDMVTPEELNAFFQPLINLETLKFGECFMSSVPGGQELTSLGRLKNLKELFLNDNLLITNAALASIGRGCINLEVIDVSGCNRSVSDEGVAELANLPRLVQVNISLLRAVTDQAVMALARNGRLTALLLHRCDHISDTAIVELANKCKNLNKLDVSYCPKVTDMSIWALFRLVDGRNSKSPDGGRLKVWIAHSGASQPTHIYHTRLLLNETENVPENSLEPVLFDIW